MNLPDAAGGCRYHTPLAPRQPSFIYPPQLLAFPRIPLTWQFPWLDCHSRARVDLANRPPLLLSEVCAIRSRSPHARAALDSASTLNLPRPISLSIIAYILTHPVELCSLVAGPFAAPHITPAISNVSIREPHEGA